MPSFQRFHLAGGLFRTSKPSFSHELIPLAGSFPVDYLCVHSTGSAFLGTPNITLITQIPSGTSLLATSLSFSFFFPKVREITPTFHGCCESTKKSTEFCSQLLNRPECLCLFLELEFSVVAIASQCTRLQAFKGSWCLILEFQKLNNGI